MWERANYTLDKIFKSPRNLDLAKTTSGQLSRKNLHTIRYIKEALETIEQCNKIYK